MLSRCTLACLEDVRCLQLDTAESLRAVDMGPPAESPKAAGFREFWGDRAELRRFKVTHCYCSLSNFTSLFCNSYRISMLPI